MLTVYVRRNLGSWDNLYRHFTHKMKYHPLVMNVDIAWKVFSIALTGAFGVLGLAKDFKDKKGNITKWGRISLAGILLSTTLGIVFQLRESSKAERAERATAEQTLGIVRDIQRGLSPLDEPKFYVSFSLACDLPSFSLFCKTLSAKGADASYYKTTDWSYWPMTDRPSLFLEINFFVDANDAKLYGEGRKGRGDLWFQVEPSTAQDSLFAHMQDGQVTLIAQDAKPVEFQSDGKIQSILDTAGVTVVMRANYAPDTSIVVPRVFDMTFKNGQSIRYSGPFEQVSAPRFTCFRFKLPKQP